MQRRTFVQALLGSMGAAAASRHVRARRDAVAVYFRGDQLGYVPQLENRAIAQMLDRGARLEARITKLDGDGHAWHRVRMSISLA